MERREEGEGGLGLLPPALPHSLGVEEAEVYEPAFRGGLAFMAQRLVYH